MAVDDRVGCPAQAGQDRHPGADPAAARLPGAGRCGAAAGVLRRETSTIDQAIARKDLVFIDRERATAASRSLFGFSVPSFGGLFGGDENEIKEIQSTITAIANNADGGWTLRLADGSTWTQTDDSPLGIRPARGHKVVVRRGVLGAFRVSVNGQPGFKAKRIG